MIARKIALIIAARGRRSRIFEPKRHAPCDDASRRDPWSHDGVFARR
jgi:hypothetical protein